MNHGQFDRTKELVAAVHKDGGGIHPTYRAAHAFGRIYAGTFTATRVAKTLSRATHFQGAPVPVTARLSSTSGDPDEKPANIIAMATKFYLPDGTVTDLIGITLPAFLVGTPDDFIGFVEAKAVDPATGLPNMPRLMAFLAKHPETARVVQMLQTQLAPRSLAETAFRPLHTYRFVNAAGDGRWARYHWEPEAGIAGQPVDELAQRPHDYLFDEFEARLGVGPVTFRLDLQLAQEGDPVHDPSAFWPDDRERVAVGQLLLTARIQRKSWGTR